MGMSIIATKALLFILFFLVSFNFCSLLQFLVTYTPGLLRVPAAHHHLIVGLHQPASQRQPEVPAAQYHHALPFLLMGIHAHPERVRGRLISALFLMGRRVIL